MSGNSSMPAESRLDEATSRFLDAARWLSALVVVMSHAGQLLLISPDDVVSPPWWLTIYFCLRNGGHAAVVVFFVVSGFLVGGQELTRLLDGRSFELGRYAIQRFSRIYVVLVPALLLTSILDLIGQHYFNQSLLYTVWSAYGVDSLKYVIADHHNVSTLLGNLLMLQTIVVAPFGANGPLWSLANEWWYYVVFGLILLALSTNRTLIVRVAATCMALGILGVLPVEISWWFALWLMGVAAKLLHRVWYGLPFRVAIVLSLAVLGATLYGMTWPPMLDNLPTETKQVVRLLLDGCTAVAFVLLLLSARNRAPLYRKRLHQIMASFSYTLYLVHFPVLILLGAATHDLFAVQLASWPRAPNIGLIPVFVVIACVLAWAFASLTERHTSRVRNALMRLLPRLYRSSVGLLCGQSMSKGVHHATK